MSTPKKEASNSQDKDLLAKAHQSSLPSHELLTTTLSPRGGEGFLPGLSRRSLSAQSDRTGDEKEKSLNILDLISLGASIVRAHYMLFTSVFFCILLLSYLFWAGRPKIYQAQASLQIDPKPPRPLGRGVEGVVELGSGNFWNTVEYYKTQHELLASQPVALAVVKELRLGSDRRFLLNLPDDAPLPLVEPEDTPASDLQLARLLSSRLAVTPRKQTRLVDITYQDSSPRRAERILQAVLRAYVAYNLNRVLDSTSSAVEWLGVQLDTLRSQLNESEIALHEYKLDKQIASLGIDDQTSLLKSEMSQISSRRTLIRVRIQEVKAALAQLASIDASKPNEVPQLDVFRASGWLNLRQSYMNAHKKYSELIAGGKGVNHPAVKSVRASLDELEGSLTREIKSIRAGSKKELSALNEEEKGLAQLLAQAKKQALDLNLMEIEYSRLKRTKDNNEKLYSLILERSKEAGLTQMLKFDNIHILSSPKASNTPVKPRIEIYLSLGVLLGALFGFSAALGRQRFERTIQSIKEVENLVGVPSLVSIPNSQMTPEGEANASPGPHISASESKHLLEWEVLKNPQSAYTEAVRTLRTNLLFMSPDKPFRSILVTSPGASEGKTTMACALALSFAQAGKSVLLLDCDLRRARLQNVFSPARGGSQSLTGNLLNPAAYQPSELHTEVQNLSFLQAGTTPPNPAELLQSKKFKNLLAKMREDFDLILIDSSPLIVTDAAIVGCLVDSVLLVVRALKTDKQQLGQSLQSLRRLDVPLIGTVYNGVELGAKHLKYGSYYSSQASQGSQKS